MLETIKDYFKRMDLILLFLLFCFIVASYFVVYSASYDPSTGALAIDYPARQMRAVMLGFASFFLIGLVGYKRLVNLAPVFYILGLLTLLWVLLYGVKEMGATRWIEILPGKRVQPSEFFKVAWVLMLAWVFSDLEPEAMGLRKLLKKLLWVIVPVFLIFRQPDLGTASIYLASWGLVVLFVGVKRYILLITAIGALVLAPVIWGHMEDYQRLRLVNFFSPDKDPGGGGYQAIQSRIAVGSGGLTGKGYLDGTQSHLKFMPERHTDFIFSVVNEEFGFAGGAVIIGLFFVLMWRIMHIAVQFKEIYGKMLCVAVFCVVFYQFFVNICMTIGMAPVVGIPLPFVSYGGSSMLSFISMIALVNAVYMARAKKL